jgi:hypothetical protein
MKPRRPQYVVATRIYRIALCCCHHALRHRHGDAMRETF